MLLTLERKLVKARRFYRTNKKTIIISMMVSLATAVVYQHFELQKAQASVEGTELTQRLRQTEEMCLAKNIYYEAGTENHQGKVAVAQVTINRVRSGFWGDTVCEVVYAKKQFSWTNRRFHRNPSGKHWEESKAVAKNTLYGNARLPAMNTALFYHSTHVNPDWVDPTHKITQVGHHIFYSAALDTGYKVSK